jgi:hypothetical protein
LKGEIKLDGGVGVRVDPPGKKEYTDIGMDLEKIL